MSNLSKAAYDLLKEQGLKQGSIVKVLTSWPSNSFGFDASWQPDMDSFIDKECEVGDIFVNSDSVRIKLHYNGDYWWFPPQVLQFISAGLQNKLKLTSDYTAEIDRTAKVVRVGCQTISFDTVHELARLISLKD